MTVLSIPLPEDRLAKLRELARAAGLSPEELVRARLEEWLSEPGDDFARAARYVLEKNAELYRRLA